FEAIPFLLSPEADLRHHLRSSADRLLLHWTGAAWLLTGLWWGREIPKPDSAPATLPAPEVESPCASSRSSSA
ncbi:MAG: hypothetical protein KDB80_04335, partial [Planctomycetes bacterium]|nr:hypothetical protein [Planctomycetota bacterium]